VQWDLNMKGMINGVILSAPTDYMEIHQEENNS